MFGPTIFVMPKKGEYHFLSLMLPLNILFYHTNKIKINNKI
jgi:hypothetical protein